MKSKWRILPKQFGDYRGKKLFEMEQICVGTKTMNYKGYLNCRNYSFIAKLMGHPLLKPISTLTQKIGIHWFDFSLAVTNKIKNDKYQSKFKDLFEDFCRESHEELFETKSDAMNFYRKEENYKKLLNGDIGENLMSKYTARGLLVLDDIITTLFDVIRNDFSKNTETTGGTIIDSAEEWMKNLYLINEIYSDDKKFKLKKEKLTIDFDFPSWLENNSQPFKKYKKNSTYKFNLDQNKINYIRDEIDSITLVGKDKNRAFARYLERRHSESGFFKKEYQKVI